MKVNLLDVADLTKAFALKSGGVIRAVDDVSFTQTRGETIGIVGESGCGKSTLGRLILQLIKPTSGGVRFLGKELTLLPDSNLRQMRRHMQMIFQDPFASLDPRMRVGTLIEEPLVIHDLGTKAERVKEVARRLETVGLSTDAAKRYPHEFSGGQRQRICIARALALHPDLIIADEPVSALDVSIQAQVLNLIADIQERHNLAYLFISHDLSVVRHIADEVMVMYLGRVVEQGPRDTIFANPQHPYTKALLSAPPQPNPMMKRERIVLKGELPSPLSPPPGCTFHPRCPWAFEPCGKLNPVLLPHDGSLVACHAVNPISSRSEAA